MVPTGANQYRIKAARNILTGRVPKLKIHLNTG